MTSQPPAARESYQHREMAESFGTDAERYDRARPRYPAGLIERLAAEFPGGSVLDVGTGTGIVARQLAAAGATVLGVEPDARMADLARRLGVDVEVGTIEEWDPAGRTFDTVVGGQVWHWVEPVAGARKAAEVLRPGGRLAVFWNAGDPEPEVARGFAEVYRGLADVLPPEVAASLPATMTKPAADLYAPGVTRAAEGMAAAGAFAEPEEWRFAWEFTYTRDAWLDQVPTQGLFTRLPPDRLDPLLAEIGAVIDANGGGFTMRFTTLVSTAVRR